MSAPDGRRPVVGNCDACNRNVWTHIKAGEDPDVPVRCGECGSIARAQPPTERQKAGHNG